MFSSEKVETSNTCMSQVLKKVAMNLGERNIWEGLEGGKGNA